MKTWSNTKQRGAMSKLIPVFSGVLILVLFACNSAYAYERAGSCNRCHGDFDDSESPKGTIFPLGSKHEMHRHSSYMNTDCSLCHNEEEDNPLLTNCAGCHVGAGLRAHHVANSVNCYTGCHSAESSPGEHIKPPYYGTAGTRVDNSCNDVLVANTNENWSIGDFIGLDNDGDNLYDLADFDCGPPYKITVIAIEGGNVRITWESVGGRLDMLQSAPDLNQPFSDVGSALVIPGVGITSTNAVEVGGVTSSNRFYRIRYAP